MVSTYDGRLPRKTRCCKRKKARKQASKKESLSVKKAKITPSILTRELNKGIDLTGTRGLTRQKKKKDHCSITEVATEVRSYHPKAGRENTRKTSSLRMDCLLIFVTKDLRGEAPGS